MTEGDAGAWVHALAVLSSEMEDSDDIDDVREDARRCRAGVLESVALGGAQREPRGAVA